MMGPNSARSPLRRERLDEGDAALLQVAADVGEHLAPVRAHDHVQAERRRAALGDLGAPPVGMAGR